MNQYEIRIKTREGTREVTRTPVVTTAPTASAAKAKIYDYYTDLGVAIIAMDAQNVSAER